MNCFPKIAVLGPGLLGGSVALACQKVGVEVILWGRREERVACTRKLALQATTDIAKAVEGADLVILAVPVGAMTAVTESMLDHLKVGCLVTDVGSVKVAPHQSVGAFLKSKGIDFIGSHPMAGSEQTGVEAARAELFKGAACVITNDEGVSQGQVNELQAFWESLGCRVEHLDAADHDRAVARISHFPHAMAVITADIGLSTGDEANLAGGGFRDTSRVASGESKMWAEIMIENRVALLKVMGEAQDSLRDMLVILENSDEEGLQKFLAEVKARRDQVS
ncbi:prephenate dehydrogenase/arogenate dehydrogenase family protein [Akkermansiaceae bacterium]|nr:prephenate dehydrogenase/arogenate dehydrogenase family protein [Akkermansiaceae bacterium]